MSTGRVQPTTRAPADRNRVVDLVRVLALVAVVTGHWLKQGWYVDAADGLHRAGLLGIAPWTHPLTWLFQVIPVFFVVGGFANARSWRSARARGESYGGWLAVRTERLTRPVVPLLVFWVVATPLAPLLGLGGDWVRIASLTSLVPTWFLATYVVIVATTPVGLALWERWGAGAPAAGVVAACAVDAWSLRTGSLAVGGLNLFLVWGTLQQVGFAWSDGWFGRRRRAVACAVGGLGATALLVWLGPYGMSMAGVSGHGVNNTYPPRVTLLFLGLFLAGTAVALEPQLSRVASSRRVWSVTVVLEANLMTIYLWHLTALGILGAVSLWLGGVGLDLRPNTRDWWLLRPAWLLALAATTAVLTLLLSRWERPTGRRAAAETGPLLPLLEVAVTTGALAVLASEGMTRGRLTWAVALGAAVALLVLDRYLCPPVANSGPTALVRRRSVVEGGPTGRPGTPPGRRGATGGDAMSEKRTIEDARARREALDEVARRGGPSSATEAALKRYLASEQYHAHEAEEREKKEGSRDTGSAE